MEGKIREIVFVKENQTFAGGQNVCHLWQAVYMEKEMGKVLVGNNHM